MPSTSSPSLSSKMQRIFHWLPKPWKQTAILVAFFVFLLLTVNLISNTKKFQREKTIEELQQMVSITRIDTSKPSTEIDQEKVYKKTNMVDEASSELLKLQSKKLILFYTTLWGRERWKGFETTSNFNNWGGKFLFKIYVLEKEVILYQIFIVFTMLFLFHSSKSIYSSNRLLIACRT